MSQISHRRWWRSGWLPTGSVLLLTVVLLRVAAEVEVQQSLRFAAYVGGWLALPGTIAWRLLDTRRHRERPRLGEDLALGVLLGLVLELPVYLACLALGASWLYLGWPLVWLALLVALHRRRGERPVGAPRDPAPWSRTTAALVAFLVLLLAHSWWDREPVTDTGLRQAFVDEPFHLSIVAAIQRGLPLQHLFVDDTPLRYHWASHLHVAAASTVTGLEPALLLRALALPTVLVLSMLALGHVAARLTGAEWTRPVTLVAVLVAPAAYSYWVASPSVLLSRLALHSPSAMFAHAALVLLLLLVVEALRDRRITRSGLALVLVVMLALTGAKSTSLPALAAGLIGATAVVSVLERRVLRVGAALSAVAVVAFVTGTALFVGGGSHGLGLDPLAITRFQLTPLGTDGENPTLGLRLLALPWLLGFLSLGASLVLLLRRGGWRDPVSLWLLGSCAAGLGAALSFGQEGISELYFGYGMMPTLVLGAVLGLHRGLEIARPPRGTLVTGAGAGLVTGLLLTTSSPWWQPSEERSLPWRAFVSLTLPAVTVLALATVLTVAVAVVVSGRSRSTGRGPVALTLAAVLAGLGLTSALLRGLDIAADPLPGPSPNSPTAEIGEGGLDAARWVRSHLPSDAVLATNAHCREPGERPPCDVRSFWMAGWSERQLVVSGWAFVPTALDEGAGASTTDGPFWDAERLTVNDAALLEASPRSLAELRRRYGAGWALIDTRYDWDEEGLRRSATVVHETGSYVVLRLP